MTRLLELVKREFMFEHGYRCFYNVLKLLRNYTIRCVILKWRNSSIIHVRSVLINFCSNFSVASMNLLPVSLALCDGFAAKKFVSTAATSLIALPEFPKF